jgi:bifunctional DNase/RNase
VRVETLREATYYAVTKLRSGDTVQEVDTRPSDAIALALRMDSPIHVAEEVLEKSGIEIPEGIGLTPRRGGLDEIKEKIGEKQSTEVQRLIDFLFGEEA